ncbi:MAG: hypothetical protein V3V84_00605 [Candidatus Bathyarchaeia archaeon]
MTKDPVISISKVIKKKINEFYDKYKVYPTCLFVGKEEAELVLTYDAQKFIVSLIPPRQNQTRTIGLSFILVNKHSFLEVGICKKDFLQVQTGGIRGTIKWEYE